jgi:hypothetical protein
MRGLAAVIMLQGHTFHAFTKPEHREHGLYIISQFFGGIAPAVFLFLTGVTLAFRFASRERLGVSAGGRLVSGLRRAGYLLMIAMLFRLQLWLFGWPSAPWTDLLKVDILNCMALAVATLSITAIFQTTERIRICAALGVAIAAAGPLITQLKSVLGQNLLTDYLAPNHNFFSYFPWAAFVAFGMSVGSVLRVVPPQRIERTVQWFAIAGFGLILSARYIADLPYGVYAQSDFWLDSPWLIFIKLGVLLLILSAAYLWNEHAVGTNWSWVRQLGVTSLLVYWVHIELVYGRWLSNWKDSLSAGQVVIAAAGLIVMMVGLSVAKTQWKSWMPSARAALSCYFSPSRRVSGD